MHRAYGMALAALLALVGCQSATVSRVDEVRPGQRPALNSDEAGLWLHSDRLEREISRSGRVIADAQLDAYLRSIACRLSPQHCKDIRVQVVRSPGFNATMSPNGHMLVWSGMLLRAENEAQLAFVLAHELSHYLQRHSVKRWRDMRNSTDAAAFLQVITLGAGVGLIGQLGSLVAMSSIYSFSRDQETEADTLGFEMVEAAGYDTSQAPRIWAGLLEENRAQKKPEQSVFFASHPSAENRLAALSDRAQRPDAKSADPIVGTERHRQAIEAHRLSWFDDELTKREFAATLVLLDRLENSGSDKVTESFTRGELYRLRRDDGDDSLALAAYRRALAAGDPPAVVHRSSGLVHWRIGDRGGARSAFQRYLKAAPNAADITMIQSYISRLEQ